MSDKQKLLSISFFFFSFLLISVFQNCAPGSNATAGNSSLDTGNTGGTLDSDRESIASFEILPNAPYAKLSDSGILKMMGKKNYVNFKEYAPQYPLYSDNATKRRFFYMGKDAKVDTASLDEWIFPKETVFWKEFSIDGKKVETRVWEKISGSFGVAAWRPSVYVWRADQSEADLLTVDDFYSKPVSERLLYQAGQIETKYKLLTMSSCVRCHSAAKDVALGFNYLELSKKELGVNIFSLKARGQLSAPPLFEDEIKGTQKARDAIGYMQTNCATCHNGGLYPPRNFKHVSSVLNYQDENVMKAINSGGSLITFGDLANSRIYQRMISSPVQMPPIGLIQADIIGTKVISDWIMEGAPPVAPLTIGMDSGGLGVDSSNQADQVLSFGITASSAPVSDLVIPLQIGYTGDTAFAGLDCDVQSSVILKAGKTTATFEVTVKKDGPGEIYPSERYKVCSILISKSTNPAYTIFGDRLPLTLWSKAAP